MDGDRALVVSGSSLDSTESQSLPLIAQFWAWAAFGVVQSCSILQHNRIVFLARLLVGFVKPRDVLNGVPYVSKEVDSPSDPPPSEEDFDLALLSERELEIFRYLGRGNPTRQIAEALGISIKTAQVHCATSAKSWVF